MLLGCGPTPTAPVTWLSRPPGECEYFRAPEPHPSHISSAWPAAPRCSESQPKYLTHDCLGRPQEPARWVRWVSLGPLFDHVSRALPVQPFCWLWQVRRKRLLDPILAGPLFQSKPSTRKGTRGRVEAGRQPALGTWAPSGEQKRAQREPAVSLA